MVRWMDAFTRIISTRGGMIMAKKKYYAVAKGRETGVFDSWEKCHAATDKFKGGLFKGFNNKQQAEKWLKNPITKKEQKVKNCSRAEDVSMDWDSFSEMFDDLPDGAFFAMAEEFGLSIDDLND